MCVCVHVDVYFTRIVSFCSSFHYENKLPIRGIFPSHEGAKTIRIWRAEGFKQLIIHILFCELSVFTEKLETHGLILCERSE